jgi:hypothetical protein
MIYSFGVARIQDKKQLYDSLMKTTDRSGGYERNRNELKAVEDEFAKLLKK